jgi:hypothetical protein
MLKAIKLQVSQQKLLVSEIPEIMRIIDLYHSLICGGW